MRMKKVEGGRGRQLKSSTSIEGTEECLFAQLNKVVMVVWWEPTYAPIAS